VITPVDPQGVDVLRWADETGAMLYDLAAEPRLDAAGEWRSWAASVIGLPAIAAFQPPDPVLFADWRAWAARFNEAMTSRSTA